MEQNFNNNPNDFLWTLLANPAEEPSLYAYNLQRLVNDFPQSGMLQALLAHASENKNLRQASVYFNPRSLFKLINTPGSFVGVPDDRMVIQPGIGTNGVHTDYSQSYDYPERAALQTTESFEQHVEETHHYTTEELTDTLPLEDMPPMGFEAAAEAEIHHEDFAAPAEHDMEQVEHHADPEEHHAEAIEHHGEQVEHYAEPEEHHAEAVEHHGEHVEHYAEPEEHYNAVENEEKHPEHWPVDFAQEQELIEDKTADHTETVESTAEHAEHETEALTEHHEAAQEERVITPEAAGEEMASTHVAEEEVKEALLPAAEAHIVELIEAHHEEVHHEEVSHDEAHHEETHHEEAPHKEVHLEEAHHDEKSYIELTDEQTETAFAHHPEITPEQSNETDSSATIGEGSFVHEQVHHDEHAAEELLPEPQLFEKQETEEVEPIALIDHIENVPEQEAPVPVAVEDMDETFDEIVGIENINFGNAGDKYFSFEQEFGAHEDESAQKTGIVTTEAEPQDISKYNDEKLPYSFLWWLDKTRKEHAQLSQPYVKQPAPPDENKSKKNVDELQQQYFENIFHITSVEGFEKPAPAPYAPGVPDPKRKELVIIDRFIKEEPQIRPQSSDKLDNENKAKKSSEDRDELVTETLANIYSDQMLYHKAISSYKKLMLKFPEKSRYFAEKIEALEKKTN